jgi:hypothetical protein
MWQDAKKVFCKSWATGAAPTHILAVRNAPDIAPHWKETLGSRESKPPARTGRQNRAETGPRLQEPEHAGQPDGNAGSWHCTV